MYVSLLVVIAVLLSGALADLPCPPPPTMHKIQKWATLTSPKLAPEILRHLFATRQMATFMKKVYANDQDHMCQELCMEVQLLPNHVVEGHRGLMEASWEVYINKARELVNPHVTQTLEVLSLLKIQNFPFERMAKLRQMLTDIATSELTIEQNSKLMADTCFDVRKSGTRQCPVGKRLWAALTTLSAHREEYKKTTENYVESLANAVNSQYAHCTRTDL